MSEQAEVLPNMDNISDQQVEQFFNNGGELPAEQEVAEQPVVETDSQQVAKEEPQAVNEDKATKPQKLVPYDAMYQERQRRKESDRALAEQQERVRKLEETFQKVMERVNNPAPNMPNFEEDPTEHLRAKTEQLERTLQTHNQTLAQQQQMVEQQRQYNEFIRRYQESANAYRQEQPDFQKAYDHLVEARMREYQAAGYSYQEANNMVVQDELSIASKAYQDDVNPGERIYALAKARGYQQQAQQAVQAEQPKPQKNEAVAKLEQLEKGLNAATSLSNASGNASTELTLEALSQMAEDDPNFDKAWKKLITGAK